VAEEALALHLAGMAEDEEPIPEPSSLEAVMADRENRDAVAILVKARATTTKAVRVNLTIPAGAATLGFPFWIDGVHGLNEPKGV
jgi:hypothetical protein